ncbi:MAG TPA: ribosome biogenesis GTPase Der [Kofleriaceae bacterium]|nr:ribosome biogenesis GTPase Der [Kofleriaceae bacterium]
MTALVAVVGRPNVGKSTLFNRLVGGRPALVHDTPGLTRDRRYGDVDYFGKKFRLVDTGGLDPEAETEVIGAGIHRQALRAIDEADAVLLVVDAKAGIAPLDRAIAKKIRATGRPIFLVVNKVDHQVRETMVPEFFAMGLGQPFAVSASHGRGIDELLDAVCEKLAIETNHDDVAPTPPPFADASAPGRAAAPAPVHDAADDESADDYSYGDDRDAEDFEETDGDDAGGGATGSDRKPNWRAQRHDPNRPLRVAFVGRPNAGKSSLTNRLLGEERSLVHDVAGTTTDPVDTEFSIGNKKYVLVDTAGVRKRAKVDEDIEKIAVSMAIAQIDRADVVVLVIDAATGPSEQDARLLGMIDKAGRAAIIAMNKSDLVTTPLAKDKLQEAVTDNFHFVSWVPVVNLSAIRGDGVDRLMDVVNSVAAQHMRRIATSQLNKFFAEVCEVMPPPVYRGRNVRVYYMTQATARPPTFLMWANNPQGISPSYRRFVVNRLRERYGFRGTPLRLLLRAKEGVEEQTLRKAARGAAKAKRKLRKFA